MEKTPDIVNLLHIEIGGVIIDAKNEAAIRDIQQRIIKVLEDPAVKIFIPDFEMYIRGLQVAAESVPEAIRKVVARALTPTIN